MSDQKKESSVKEYTLERDCELRFEIETKTQVVVEVSPFVYLSLELEFHKFFYFSLSRALLSCMAQNSSSLRSTRSHKEPRSLFSRIKAAT